MRYCLYILLLTFGFSLVATAAAPLLDDPARDGWNTEVLSGEAGKQLKVFAGLLSQPDPIAAAQLEGLTAPGFACRSLRPVTLETVFRDGAITVRRPQPAVAGTENQTAPTGDGVAVLQQLRRPYTHGYIPRAELKVTGIEMTTAGFETVVLVSFFGRAAGGSLEETATWRCGWQPQQAGPPLLISMTTVKYEQIMLATERPTLFSDCSEAVMGGNNCYREQLLHGIAYWVQRIEFMQGIDVNGYLGIALGDVDGDGLDDVYIAQEGGLPNRLLRHNPDGTVTDISAAAGVDWMAATSGVLLADFDNDGDQDLVCATLLGALRVGCDLDVSCPVELPALQVNQRRHGAGAAVKVHCIGRSGAFVDLGMAQGCIQGGRFIHRPEVVVIAGDVRDSVEMAGRRIDFAVAGGLMQNGIRRRRCEYGAARQSARQRHDSGTYNTSLHSHAPLALLRNDFCAQARVVLPRGCSPPPPGTIS